MRGFAALRTVTQRLRAVRVNDEGTPMGTVYFEPGQKLEVIKTSKGMTGFGIVPSKARPGEIEVFIAFEKAVLLRTNPTEGIGCRIMNKVNPPDHQSVTAI